MSKPPKAPQAKGPAPRPRAARPQDPDARAAPPAKGDGARPGGERIAKVLARAGIASRRDAEAMITEGRIQVNGKVITSPALNLTARDRVLVDGKPLPAPEPPRLWMYHKPVGVVSTARDEKGRATMFDDLPADLPRVMSVGRLDLNSEGLLLLTNDGDLKRRLELPATGWVRKYRVRVNGTPDDTRLAPLRTGITVEGENFLPMSVNIDRQQGANAWLTVGIREGRNREIRRAMEAVGLVVNRLIRTAYGPFALGDLAPGAVREISARAMRDQLGMDIPQPARPTAKPASRAPGDAPAGATFKGKGPRKPPFKGASSGKAAPAGADRAARGPGTKPDRTDGAKPPRAGVQTGARTGAQTEAKGARTPGPASASKGTPGTLIAAPGRKSWGTKSRPKPDSTDPTGAPARARGFRSHKGPDGGTKGPVPPRRR